MCISRAGWHIAEEVLIDVTNKVLASPFEGKYRHLCISKVWLLGNGVEDSKRLLRGLQVSTRLVFKLPVLESTESSLCQHFEIEMHRRAALSFARTPTT